MSAEQLWRSTARSFRGDAEQGEHLHAQEARRAELQKLDQEIEAYGKSLEDNDAAEASQRGNNGSEDGGGDGRDIAAKVSALMARRLRAQADLDRLEASGD